MLTEISGIPVELIRKRVRYVSVTVYPPDGRVRVSAPLRAATDLIRSFVASRRDWIERQRLRVRSMPVAPALEYVSGEAHLFLGRVYRLNVIETASGRRPRGEPAVRIQEEAGVMELTVPAGASKKSREKILLEWHRAELLRLIPPRLARWESLVGAEAHDWGVKRMKTKWGTCNTRARRIWIALELAKKPLHLLDYILAHELTHLLEASHNARFKALMDRVLPDWREHRRELQNNIGLARPKNGPHGAH